MPSALTRDVVAGEGQLGVLARGLQGLLRAGDVELADPGHDLVEQLGPHCVVPPVRIGPAMVAQLGDIPHLGQRVAADRVVDALAAKTRRSPHAPDIPVLAISPLAQRRTSVLGAGPAVASVDHDHVQELLKVALDALAWIHAQVAR